MSLKTMENEEIIQILADALQTAIEVLDTCAEQEVQYSSEWRQIQAVIKQAGEALKAAKGCR